jgi:glycerophosphoryl diester phosphodiesterase
MTADEIAPARTKKSGQPLSYLEDLLDFLKDKEGAFVQVEIKCKNYTDAEVAEMCAIMIEMVKNRIDPAKVIFISFEPRALQKIKALKADQQTCLLSDEASAHVIKTALEMRAEGVSAQLNNLSRTFVRDAHKAGLKVTTWTIKNTEDAQLALALGVDSVASDIPALQLEKKTARP